MSKLRTIQAINTRGIVPAVLEAERPKLMWVDPTTLYVEDDYQREIVSNSIWMIRKIVTNWNWAHIKAAICVRDASDRLVVIDGQHTAIAAVSHGGIDKIPVMVVEAKTVKDRAAAFISQNRDRLALTPMHIHHAAVAAGDEVAVAVAAACARVKATILRCPRGQKAKYKVGETFAVGIITRIVSRVGVHHAARVLKVLIDAKRAPLSAHEIAAVYQLLYDDKYRGKVEAFDLVTVIRSRPMDDWRARAWQLVASGTARREATAAVWFKALPKKAG